MPRPTQQRRPRHWFQFSLRALFVVVAVVAGLAFAWMKAVEPYRLQREAMGAITKLGGTYKTEDATGWVRYLDKNAQDVVVVDLADCDAPSEYLPHLARLPRLRTLVVGGHSVGDEQVAALGGIKSLKGLVLYSTLATDEGVETLNTALPDLVVYKSERRAVAELRRFGVAYVALFGRDPGQDKWRDWPAHEVDDLYVVEPPVDTVVLGMVGFDTRIVADDDLVHLTALGKLQTVSLANTRITDSSIAHLEKCTHLTFLDITGTDISPGGVKRLKAALPTCDIRY